MNVRTQAERRERLEGMAKRALQRRRRPRVVDVRAARIARDRAEGLRDQEALGNGYVDADAWKR